MVYLYQKFPEKNAPHLLLRVLVTAAAVIWCSMLSIRYGNSTVVLFAALWHSGAKAPSRALWARQCPSCAASSRCSSWLRRWAFWPFTFTTVKRPGKPHRRLSGVSGIAAGRRRSRAAFVLNQSRVSKADLIPIFIFSFITPIASSRWGLSQFDLLVKEKGGAPNGAPPFLCCCGLCDALGDDSDHFAATEYSITLWYSSSHIRHDFRCPNVNPYHFQ